MSDDVARSRERFERSLSDLARAVESELGTVPRIGRWALVVAAGAAGFVLGGVLGGKLGARLGDRARRRHLRR